MKTGIGYYERIPYFATVTDKGLEIDGEVMRSMVDIKNYMNRNSIDHVWCSSTVDSAADFTKDTKVIKLCEKWRKAQKRN